MNTTTVRTRLVLVLAPLVFATLAATSSALACVVGTGTSASCTEAALNACLPGGGSFDGTVTFACGGAATITVTSTKTISADTTIDGGSLITISGGGTVGVFSVNSGVTFTVQNLTIVNGVGPFCVSEDGTCGGGIENFGTLAVTNCTFSGNSAVGGGGIHNENGGTATVTNSTFAGNSAVGGGAILNVGTLLVTNCTFSGNSTLKGGAINNGGTATVTNSTFSGNGHGAIGNAGAVTLVNSILVNSTSGGNCFGAGIITDGGHNIDDGTTCGFTGTGCTNTTGTSFCNTNPLLDPAGLASNGGPTQTIALEAGSPAINAGDETVCAAPPVNNLDQRGFVRPGVGATNCSIGADEFDSSGPGSTTTTTSTMTTITTTTSSTTVTSTTTPALPTTTTTLPCTTARCTLGAALMSPVCAGQTIPASVTGKLTTAENLIEQAATTPGKKARKVRRRTRNLLKQAGTKATRAAKGKKAKLSAACSAALKDAAGRVAAGL